MILIPVNINYINNSKIELSVIGSMNDCPKCKEGKGCGEKPWFRFFSDDKIILDLGRKENYKIGETLYLVIPEKLINLAAFFIYGLPLILFMLVLFLTQNFSELWQMVFALMSIMIAALINRQLNYWLLKENIQLKRKEEIQDCVNKVSY